jgi:hypothetical protein
MWAKYSKILAWSILLDMPFFLLCLFSTCAVCAAYIGNPAGPGIMNHGFFTSTYPIVKATTGYYADYISDMRFVPTQESPDFNPEGSFRKFGLHSQMATASLIFMERIEFFGSAGGSKEHAKFSEAPSVGEVADVLLDFQSTYTFSWSAGARLVVLKLGPAFVCTDFTYFQVPSTMQSYFKFLNRLNLPLETEKQPFSIDEWQIAAALALRLFFVTPYVGGCYMKAKLNIHSGVDVPPLYYENKEHWGYFYGLTVSLTGRFHLNFERRMRDEFAYSFATVAVF